MPVNGYTRRRRSMRVSRSAFRRPEFVRTAASTIPEPMPIVFVDDANVPRYPPIARYRHRHGRAGRADRRRSAHAADQCAERRSAGARADQTAARAAPHASRSPSSTPTVRCSAWSDRAMRRCSARTCRCRRRAPPRCSRRARPATFLDGLPNANYLVDGTSIAIGDYVTAAQTFLDDPGALARRR